MVAWEKRIEADSEDSMLGNRLNQIRYLFPSDRASRAWFDTIAPVMAEAPQAEAVEDRLVIVPDYPPQAIPATTLELSRVDRPTVVLDTIGLLVVFMGGIRLLGWASRDPMLMPPGVAVTPPHPPISPDALADALRGHIVRIDDTGVELPTPRVPRPLWERLLDALGAATNLYEYPAPDTEMPFVLPANGDEFVRDITTFDAPRTPKFELTYGYVSTPLLQFHLDTDLDRAALDALLPAPSGFNLPGADGFRSVYVETPWPGAIVRFDLSYWVGDGLTEWDSGEWLVAEGLRLRGRF